MPESNEVEETTATEVKEAESDSLHDLLNQQTEVKAPSAHASGPAWNLTDEIIDEEKPAAEPKADIKSPKIPDDVKKASAETLTLMFDGLLQLTCNGILNAKFNKKFTAAEKQTIVEKDLEDKLLDEIEEADRLLKRKWDRYNKQRDRKLKQIPLDSDEFENVKTAFYHYTKTKDVAMPPEALLALTLGTIMVNRGIEVSMD